MYRLPLYQEWHHAHAGGGSTHSADFGGMFSVSRPRGRRFNGIFLVDIGIRLITPTRAEVQRACRNK